jgi:hypothetical protein
MRRERNDSNREFLPQERAEVGPSEKNALRVVSDPFPANPSPQLAPATRGGTGSARPQGMPALDRGMCSLGHRLIFNHPLGMGCPGLRPASIRGRGDRTPPRKTLCALSQGLPRKALLAREVPPRRGGPRTPVKARLGLNETRPR